MSTLQIELDAETENRLERLSRQEGSAMGEIASRLLAQAARTARPTSEIKEAELLQKINEGWSPEGWDRYHALTSKRRTAGSGLCHNARPGPELCHKGFQP